MKRNTINKIASLTLTETDKKYLALNNNLKLKIELVPSSCWFSSCRRNLNSTQWDKIRKGAYAKANNVCEICGGQGTQHNVECHDVWNYNDKTLIQKLDYFQAVCPLCHEVKHIGLAGVLRNGERAFNRFKKINNLNQEIAYEIKGAVFKEWRIRSEKKWKIDIDLLTQYEIDIIELQNKVNNSFKLRSQKK